VVREFNIYISIFIRHTSITATKYKTKSNKITSTEITENMLLGLSGRVGFGLGPSMGWVKSGNYSFVVGCAGLRFFRGFGSDSTNEIFLVQTGGMNSNIFIARPSVTSRFLKPKMSAKFDRGTLYGGANCVWGR